MSFSKKLASGRIARIRVNPTNCVSVLDVIDKLPIPFKEQMSFDQCVSMALSSLLETARQQGLIKENDGFDYLNRMSRFHSGHAGQHGKKLEITKAVGELGSRFHAPVIAHTPEGYVEPELTADQRRAWTRIKELTAKMELAETEGSGVVWSAGDQMEYDKLAALV